jgi:hypothetical protein
MRRGDAASWRNDDGSREPSLLSNAEAAAIAGVGVENTPNEIAAMQAVYSPGSICFGSSVQRLIARAWTPRGVSGRSRGAFGDRLGVIRANFCWRCKRSGLAPTKRQWIFPPMKRKILSAL